MRPTACREVLPKVRDHLLPVVKTHKNLAVFRRMGRVPGMHAPAGTVEKRPGVSSSRRLLLRAERLTWTLGLIGLMAWGWYYIRSTTSTRQDLERFAALGADAPNLNAPIVAAPDQSFWSSTRVSAWRKAASEPRPAPLAVLRIPKIRLELPVLPGTDDCTLDRGVGHIEYTVEPGTDGNSGIAGHRDSFFRGLKDIGLDDVIELDTHQGTDVYRVERTWIVNPEDVSVLDPTPTRALTLVTCYPFYFVGAAPQRFIVRAVLVSSKPVTFSRSVIARFVSLFVIDDADISKHGGSSHDKRNE